MDVKPEKPSDGVEVPTEFRQDLQLAQAAERSYAETGDPEVLQAAIAAWTRILDRPDFATAPGPFQLATFYNASRSFQRRYRARRQWEDLEQALALWEQLAARMPPDSPELVQVLAELGQLRRSRWERTSQLEDLDRSIAAFRQAVDHAPPDSGNIANTLVDLGASLGTRFMHTGVPGDLEDAIQTYQQAIRLAAPGSGVLGLAWKNLGTSYWMHFGQSSQAEDLTRAVDSYQEAVTRLPPGSPDLVASLGMLGACLATRYNLGRQPQDLDRSIAAYAQALAHAPAQLAERPMFLENLASGLELRHAQVGRAEDLERLIEVYGQLVDLMPPGSPDHFTVLVKLSDGLLTSYERTNAPAELDQAIAIRRQAVVHASVDPGRVPGLLIDLGASLEYRYRLTNEQDDLEEAIQVLRQAVQGLPAESDDLASALNNLGNSLYSRYLFTGEAADLDEAIEISRQSLEATAPGSPYLPSRLTNLGSSLRERFTRAGLLEDVQEAIALQTRAVQVTPTGSPELAGHYNSLGNSLMVSAGVTDRADDLDRAIAQFERSVQLTPSEQLVRLRRQNGLVAALLTRYSKGGKAEDLQRALDLSWQVVDHSPPDWPELPAYLNNLALALRNHYRLTGNRRDLAEAIKACRRAVQITPAESPALVGYLFNLAEGLRERYDKSHAAKDLREGQALYRTACQQGLALALDKALISAQTWGSWAWRRQSWLEAAEAYQYGRQAVDLLVATQLGRAAKEMWLGEVQRLPGRHAYALAKLGRLEEAVEALEAGRARLLAEALEQNRRDLERLPELGHGDLLERYRRASARLQLLQQQPSQRSETGALQPGSPGLGREMDQARAELDATIAAIRQVEVDGHRPYGSFLLPPAFAAIQQAALPPHPQDETGAEALVYLVATPAGSLALIVTHTQVESLWLDRLSETQLVEALYGPASDPALGGYLGAYDRWLRQPAHEASRAAWFDTLDTITHWLWETLVGLLAGHLQAMGVPRATIIPAGLLGLLPLHVAWTEDAGTPTGRRYVLDTLAIAYAPNAGALAVSRELAGRVAADRVLAVDNPDGSLRFAGQEVEAVLSYFPRAAAKVLRGPAATAEAVLGELPSYPVLHFSTHGWANVRAPLASGLLMATTPHLTLRDLLELRHPGARLAVLSACETATPGTKLPDEVVSLPTGLVQAGVAGVVASLWSVNDLSTAMLMERFYRLWKQDGLSPAEALRQAQVWLRDTTNREKNMYFGQDAPALAAFLSQRMPEHVALSLFEEQMGRSADPEARDFAHPFWWAAFSMTGV